eukprot:4583-Heterococcus_DN1.PRE.2
MRGIVKAATYYVLLAILSESGAFEVAVAANEAVATSATHGESCCMQSTIVKYTVIVLLCGGCVDATNSLYHYVVTTQ